jgi:UDP-N-acetylmuramate-alanine ligase
MIAAAAADAAPGRRVAWLPDFDAAERFLAAELRSGDLVLAMGAGDVDALGRSLVAGPLGQGPRVPGEDSPEVPSRGGHAP